MVTEQSDETLKTSIDYSLASEADLMYNEPIFGIPKPYLGYGQVLKQLPPKRQKRNSICKCGSGKKHKKCCYSVTRASS